jgi:hypothetical protein
VPASETSAPLAPAISEGSNMFDLDEEDTPGGVRVPGVSSRQSAMHRRAGESADSAAQQEHVHMTMQTWNTSWLGADGGANSVPFGSEASELVWAGGGSEGSAAITHALEATQPSQQRRPP